MKRNLYSIIRASSRHGNNACPGTRNVSDETGDPVIGTSIWIKGTGQGTVQMSTAILM